MCIWTPPLSIFLDLPLSHIVLHQATPREPRAAIASHVLLTYPAHLGIHSHAYLLCHYSNSSNPSGAPSGNCFTCLTHIPSTPWYSYLLCHYSNSSNPSGAPSGNCFTCLTHIPSTPGYSFSRLSSLSLS